MSIVTDADKIQGSIRDIILNSQDDIEGIQENILNILLGVQEDLEMIQESIRDILLNARGDSDSRYFYIPGDIRIHISIQDGNILCSVVNNINDIKIDIIDTTVDTPSTFHSNIIERLPKNIDTKYLRRAFSTFQKDYLSTVECVDETFNINEETMASVVSLAEEKDVSVEELIVDLLTEFCEKENKCKSL